MKNLFIVVVSALVGLSAACGGASTEPTDDGSDQNVESLKGGGASGSSPGSPGGGASGGGSSGGGSTSPGDGTVSVDAGGGGGFSLCNPKACPAQIPAIARICPDGSAGQPVCARESPKARCGWTFVCGL